MAWIKHLGVIMFACFKRCFGVVGFNFKNQFALPDIKIFYVLLFLSSMSLNHRALARPLCGDYLNSFLYQNTNVIFFNNVDVFRQNNDIGPQQRGKLRLEKWVDFTLDFEHKSTANSAVGLTSEGKMYHVVTFEGRTIARLLNGQEIFTDFKMLQSGEIIALDAQKKTQVYFPHLWELSPRNSSLKKGLMYWGLSSAIAIGTKLALVGQTGTLPFFEFSGMTLGLPILETVVVGAAGMNTALVMANRYYHMISYPNGFVKVPVSYNESTQLFSEIRRLRIDHPELSGMHKHLEPPTFTNLPPALPKELTEGIQN